MGKLRYGGLAMIGAAALAVLSCGVQRRDLSASLKQRPGGLPTTLVEEPGFVGLRADLLGSLYADSMPELLDSQFLADGSLVFGSNLTSPTRRSFLLHRFSPEGRHVWTTELPGLSVRTFMLDFQGRTWLFGAARGVLGGASFGDTLGGYEPCLARVGSGGTLELARAFASGAVMSASSRAFLRGDAKVFVDALGGVRVGGLIQRGNFAARKYSSFGVSAASLAGPSFFLARFDSETGNTLDSTQLALPGDAPTSTEGWLFESNGSVFAYGVAEATLGGTRSGPIGSGLLAFFARFDSQGIPTWLREVGTGQSSITPGTFLLDEPGQRLLFCGSLSEPSAGGGAGDLGGQRQGLPGKREVMAVVLNTVEGTSRWLSQLSGGTGSTTLGLRCAQDLQGHLLLHGSTDGRLGGTLYGMNSLTSVFAAKLNIENGKVFWTTRIGSDPSGSLLSHGFTLDSQGNTYLYGQGSGTLQGRLYGSVGGVDIHLAKIDPDGTLLWLSDLGAGPSTETTAKNIGPLYLKTLHVLPNGHLLLHGRTTGLLGTLLGEHGAQDLFAAELSHRTGEFLSFTQLGAGTGSKSSLWHALTSPKGVTYLLGDSNGTPPATLSGTPGQTNQLVLRLEY